MAADLLRIKGERSEEEVLQKSNINEHGGDLNHERVRNFAKYIFFPLQYGEIYISHPMNLFYLMSAGQLALKIHQQIRTFFKNFTRSIKR